MKRFATFLLPTILLSFALPSTGEETEEIGAQFFHATDPNTIVVRSVAGGSAGVRQMLIFGDGTIEVQRTGVNEGTWRGRLPAERVEAVLTQLYRFGVLDFDEGGVRQRVVAAKKKNCQNRLVSDLGHQSLEVDLDELIVAGQSRAPFRISIGWTGADFDAECAPDVKEVVQLDLAFRGLTRLSRSSVLERIDP